MTETSEKKRFATRVVSVLRQRYPDAACALHFSNPLELLVATILSAQCTDQRVNLVTQELFRKYPHAADYAEAPLGQLERDIQSTGFFRNKAKSIQGCCKTLLERYQGKVPRSLEELIELPGIGRKTANVVLGTAYGIASGVVVDTHVARVVHRLGLSPKKIPEKIEADLMRQLPPQEWIRFSHRVIHHGRQICKARKPLCDRCPLNALCPRIGVE
jgi:endonuclease III